MHGNADIVEVLLAAGADAEHRAARRRNRTDDGRSHGNDRPREVAALARADVNAKEQKGQTALMWAAAEGNAEVVEAPACRGVRFSRFPSFRLLRLFLRRARGAIGRRLPAAQGGR